MDSALRHRRRFGSHSRRIYGPRAGLALLSLLALLMLGSVPTEASAGKLVLNRSMVGVKVGVSVSRLHQILGKPKSVKYLRNEITGKMRFDYYGRLSFSSYGGTVLGAQTRRRSIRTRSGIGVGTTKRRLKRTFPGLRCYSTMCSIVAGGGIATIGKRVTTFRIRNGRVRMVGVGRVID